ncbi:AMP-binding protein [Chthonobacter albigriseus]|uniref:AMP-binding protein n=1 Tax=Chthonobacter albigriseus TaxID=1683161 RepID=UPI0015EF04D5|nr:class I adenylate-forming enzyme family protein [Chthonobacter albigriseus]
MILSSEARIAAAVEAGAWSRTTVDDLFRKAAAAAPERTALTDVGASAVPGLGSSYTYADANRRIEGLAAFFSSIGLRPDMVIGIHLPPCADAAVVTLAALRAGLVVSPLPLHWTKAEMETAIGVAGIKAIVTASEIEGQPSGELVRDVAGEVFAIRFVFAVGEGLPDGLIDLAEVMAEVDALGAAPAVPRRGSPSDHVALLSFTRTVDGRLCAVPLAHAALVAMAAAHVREAGIEAGATLFDLMHPASLTGFVGCLVSSLVVDGTAAFHNGIRMRLIAEAAGQCGADRVIAPAALGPALAAALPAEVGLSLAWTGLDGRKPAAVPAARPVVDLITYGGLTLLPAARDDDGAPRDIAVGPHRLRTMPLDGPVLAEARLKGRGTRDRRVTSGELLLSGPLVPDAPWPEPVSGNVGGVLAFMSDGALRTGLTAKVSQDGATLTVTGTTTETIVVAGQAISPARVDDLLQRHPAIVDAAVFGIEDRTLGARLGVAVVNRPGRRLTLDELNEWLDAEGASVLDRPATLIAVPEIPRAADGSVARKSLFLAAVA